MPDLSIVIVNWNTKDLLINCIKSIYANKKQQTFEIVVVDNASSDGSTAMLKEFFPDINIIENDQNKGFAAANNQAFPFCSSDYVMLLNPDTVIVDDSISILLNYIGEHPEVGAVGPKVVHPETRLHVLSSGYQPTLRKLFNHYFGLSRIFPNLGFFQGINLFMGIHDDKPRSVEWIAGVCLLTRKSVLDQVGYLSEEWFMYAEDWEWCNRVKHGGWDLVHVPEAVIKHFFGASTAKNKNVSTMWVSSLRSYYINLTEANFLKIKLFDIILTSGLAFRAFLYWLRSQRKSANTNLWKEESQKFATYALAAFQASKKANEDHSTNV